MTLSQTSGLARCLRVVHVRLPASVRMQPARRGGNYAKVDPPYLPISMGVYCLKESDMRGGGLKIGRIFGIPIYLHTSWFLIFALMATYPPAAFPSRVQ